MSIKRSFTRLEKFLICSLAALHLILVTPIIEALPIKEEKLIPEAQAQMPNQPPIISSINGIPVVEAQEVTLPAIDEGKTLIIEPQVYDPDGDSFNITFINLIKLPEEEPILVTDFENTGVWYTSNKDSGNYKATVRVDNLNGGIATKDVYFTIIDKDASPVVSISLEDLNNNPIRQINKEEDFIIHVQVNDPDIDTSESFRPPDHEVTYHFSAREDTLDKKFGQKSLILDGEEDALSIPTSPDWDILASSSDDWTVDLWLKHTGYANSYEYYLSRWQGTSAAEVSWSIYHLASNEGVKFEFEESKEPAMITYTRLDDGRWHHLALIKVADEYALYIDGEQKTYRKTSLTGTLPGSLFIGAYPADKDAPDVASIRYFGGEFEGHMDEIRIQKSNAFKASPKADITDTIICPTEAHTIDKDTKLLLAFDPYQGGVTYFKPVLLIDDNPVSNLPEFVEGVVDFDKEYSINEIGPHKVTVRITDPTSGKTYEDSVYIEVTPLSQDEDAIKPLSGDFNGDGLTDIGYLDTTNGVICVSLSDEGNFNETRLWLEDANFGKGSPEGIIPLAGDFNGDGLADIGYFDDEGDDRGTFRIKFSNATSFANETIEVPSQALKEIGPTVCRYFVPITGDFNGDGLTDIGYYYYAEYTAGIGCTAGGEVYAAYSTKDGFTDFVDLGGAKNRESLTIVADFNADGLADFCTLYSKDWKLTICDGDKFISQAIIAHDFGRREGALVGDFNHDGKTDIGYFNKEEGKIHYRTFNGEGFDNEDSIYMEELKTTTENNLIPLTGDYNGDAISDIAIFDKRNFGINKWSVTPHNSNLPDLLIGIDNGIGGTTAIEYERSTKLDNTRADPKKLHDLPFPVRVVKSVTQSDGMGNSYVTKYDYRDGFFETDTREFRGFGWVKVTQIEAGGQESSYKETYFYQDDNRKGRPKKELIYDKYNRLYSETNYTWHYGGTDIEPTYRMVWSNLVPFPTLEEKETIIYDPHNPSELKSTRVEYDYDEYGNPLETKEYGFDDTVLKTTAVSYTTPNTTNWFVGKPAISIIYRGNKAEVVAETKYYYDDNDALGAEPVKGSLTKETCWLNTTGQEIPIFYSYDTYGNLTSVTNALGYATTTEYYLSGDTDQSHTFPRKVTDELGYTQHFTYDPKTGKILTAEDINQQTIAYTYDGFGRPETVVGPGGPDIRYEASYDYDLSSTPAKVTMTISVAAPGKPREYINSYSWLDGLGRTILAKRDAEYRGQNKHIVSNVVRYDSRGQITEEYLPYYADVATDFVTPQYAGLYVTYEYDPLGRVTKTIRPDNKVSQNIYGLDTVLTINEKGQRKRATKDEYGRIISVEEFSGGEIYITRYEYDTMGNLTDTYDSVTPTPNNTHIEFDSLGRKISIDCPDMGHWEYVYDAIGNLRWQKDNKDQVTGFKYDKLNRLELKGEVTAIGVEPTEGVIYQYDARTYAKGRLAKVTDPSGSTEFYYDALGREIKTIKTVNGIPYTLERSHDSLDRLRSIIYPDASVVTYTYNKQGGIESIGNATNPAFYVINAEYNEHGQVEEILYENGRKTTYNYNTSSLRLEHLVTSDAGGTDTVQDLFYSFDQVGNVKQITDSVSGSTNTQYFNYDDLNRLTSATGDSYGTISYEYDRIGNMTLKGELTLTYGERGYGPHAVTSVSGTSSYTIDYDLNGNMTEKGDNVYHWDAEKRLTKVERSQGGEYIDLNVTLNPGWNLVSLPFMRVKIGESFIPVDSASIQDILQSINGRYDQISKYETSSGEWKHYVGLEKFNQFSHFQYGEGYLIYINGTESCTFTLTGITPASEQPETLYNGWNLVGAMTPDSIDVDDQFSETGITTVKSFNGSGYDDVTELQAGKAYFVYVGTDTPWNIPVSKEETVYTYDGDGMRCLRQTDDKLTLYIGSSFEAEGVPGQPAEKITKQVYLGNIKVCSIENITGEEEERYYYHQDHIGSSNIITDKDGNIVQTIEYKPYGLTSKNEGSYNTDKLFTGKVYDTSTALYYYGARYYDPELGRFIQPDNIVKYIFDPQCLNRYTYCRNNPIIYTDPTGEFWGIFAAIIAIFSAIAKIAAVVSAVATVAAVISAVAGAQDLAKTFATIGMISGLVSLGCNLVSSIGMSIIKANTVLVNFHAPGYTGETIDLGTIVITKGRELIVGPAADVIKFANRMAAGSIITSAVASGNVVLSMMMRTALQTAVEGGRTFGAANAPRFYKHMYPDLYRTELRSGEIGFGFKKAGAFYHTGFEAKDLTGRTAVIDFNKTNEASLLKTALGGNVPGEFTNSESYDFYLVVDKSPSKISAFFELSEKLNGTDFWYNAYGRGTPFNCYEGRDWSAGLLEIKNRFKWPFRN